MSGKRKHCKKANTPPSEFGNFEFRDPVEPMESSVQELLHSMIKSFMDSVVTSINVRIDGVVKDVAELKASLEFSQKDLYDHAVKIKSIEDNVSKIEATMKKHIEKTVYLENQSRRNNLRFEGLLEDDNETWDKTEEKVKNALVEKLDFVSVPKIERAHRTGRPRRHDGTSKPRTVVVKFTCYKEKEAILKKARRIRPEGLNIFEDLAEETMEKRRAQLPQLKQAKAEGKLAYFSLDKLIIRDRPPGQIHA